MKFDKAVLADYITDADREATTGVWRAYGPKVRLKILRAGGANKRFERIRDNLLKPYRKKLLRGTLDPDTTMDVMRESYARAIVLDWEGVTDENGELVPCTPENVEELFLQVPALFDEVVEDSTSLATFAEGEAEDAEEALGNS